MRAKRFDEADVDAPPLGLAALRAAVVVLAFAIELVESVRFGDDLADADDPAARCSNVEEAQIAGLSISRMMFARLKAAHARHSSRFTARGRRFENASAPS